MYRPARRVLIIKLVFVGIFLVLAAGIWWYQLAVAKPRNACLAQAGGQWFPKTHKCVIPPGAACEASGNWWDPVSKTCAHVVYVPNITGRR